MPAFFYQWRVKPKNTPKLAVATHKGQAICNVAIMGYRTSVASAQCKIDQILRKHRSFCRAYVDLAQEKETKRLLDIYLNDFNQNFINQHTNQQNYTTSLMF